MRTREEILAEMPNDETAQRNLGRATVDILQLILEVSLDVRDAAVATQAPEKKAPKKKGILGRK